MIVRDGRMLKAKLCGMKTIEAACAAEKAGADFIGFIFWRRSHRFVEPQRAALGSAPKPPNTDNRGHEIP